MDELIKRLRGGNYYNHIDVLEAADALEAANVRITYLENQRRRLIDMADAIDVRHKARIAALAAQIAAAEKQEPVAVTQDSLALESALAELINKIDSDLDSGDIFQDARRASTAIDVILTGGDLVANAHDYYRERKGWYQNSVDFRIGWNACLDAIGQARLAAPLPSDGKDAERYRWLIERFTGYDFDWMPSSENAADGKSVAVFEIGRQFRGGRDFTEALDTEMAKHRQQEG